MHKTRCFLEIVQFGTSRDNSRAQREVAVATMLKVYWLIGLLSIAIVSPSEVKEERSD